jgi:hypothetical protein
MPNIRLTMFFEQAGQGFTESYWTTGTDPDVRSYRTAADFLANKRIKVSGEQTRLTNIRLNVEGVFRDLVGGTYPGGGLQGTIGKPSDFVDTALMMRGASADSKFRRSNYVRGIWDEVVTTGGDYVPNADFLAVLGPFVSALINRGWGWLGRTTRLFAPIATVTQDVSGAVNFTLGADLFPGPFPQRVGVRISGVLGAYQLNGPQVVVATSARIASTAGRTSIFPYTTGGRVLLTTSAFIPFDSVTARRIVERKAGRPSYKSAGRRRAKAKS